MKAWVYISSSYAGDICPVHLILTKVLLDFHRFRMGIPFYGFA